MSRESLCVLAAICCSWVAAPEISATQISAFQAGDSSGWHLGTVAVGNLLGTQDKAIIVPYRDTSGAWWLDAFTYLGQRLPGFPYYSGGDPMNVSPTVYDLDSTGRDEIIFTRGNHVIALRGDGSLLWENTVSHANYVPNGGFQTVTGGFYWYPTGAHLTHLPSTAVFSSEVSPPVVMDLNGNGKKEVITAWKIQPAPGTSHQDYNPFISKTYGGGPWGAQGEAWSGGVVTFNAETGGQTFVYHMHHLVESGLAVGRPNYSGPLNIYELNDSDSVVCFDKSKPFGLWGKGELHKQFGKNQRLMTGSYEEPVDVYTADIDGDGLDEVLVAGTQISSMWQPNETILDDDGSILWRRWLPHTSFANKFGWLNSASLIPVNPDHDNHIDVLGFNHSYEITFRYWNGVELVDRPGWPKDFYPYLPTPPVVGDVDGDGQEEIVIGTYNPSSNPSSGDLLIYALDGTLKQSIPVPGGIKHVPALADVEGLGRTDVIYESLTGMIYVQNFGATTTNNVSWATHRGNMHRDGNCGISLFPPGTPLVTGKTSGYNQTSFVWSNGSEAQAYRIYRADQSTGPFQQIATVTPSTTSYTDYNLKPGWQYFYEVGAVYETNTVLSSPFAILSQLNNNLLANAGFEEDGNSHWDKWYGVAMTNMFATTNEAFQGRQSMEVLFQNQGKNDSISQFNQYGIPDATVYTSPGAFYSYGCWFKSGGISQPSQHWLTWTSSKTGYNTNKRPSLPWPFYFTPSFVAGTGPTPWTYVNRTFQLPAGFPNIELVHGFSLSGHASGSLYLDNVFFRQIPNPASTNWTTLVPFGATWRYYINTPPANWFAPAFNDSSWPSGKAKFGAGSGPKNIVTKVAQHVPKYYFRTKFNVPSTNIEEFLLSATCTSTSGSAEYPLRLFLNGSEVQSTIDTVTSQGNDTRYFDLTPFSSMLVPGANTVGVIVSNHWSTWDDVAFDVRLQAVVNHPLKPNVSVQCPMGGYPALCIQSAPGTIWEIQSCDNTPCGDWQFMDIVTNVTGDSVTVSDTGQNGRTAPAYCRTRFYRLVPY